MTDDRAWERLIMRLEMTTAADQDTYRIHASAFTWLHLEAPAPERLKTVLAPFAFHPLVIEDCLSKTQLPKIDEYKDYLFIVLHFPRYLKDRKYSIPIQLSVLLGRDYLVTVDNGELKPLTKLFVQCKENGSCAAELERSPAFLLYRIIRSMVENLLLMSAKVLENLEHIEEKVFDAKKDAVREVTELRHDIANLKRIVFPLRRVSHELEQKVKKYANEDIGVYYSDLGDTVDRAWTVLEECKETIDIYKDTDYIISSDRTNKILALLTIVFTLSIPATIVGTFYGMNVPLPGGHHAAWTFWGPYTTFIIILSASAIPAVAMYILFRRLKWL
jgi:magnesium transporter